MVSNETLVAQARSFIEEGVWEPELLFQLILEANGGRGVHYARIRRAIHIAKGI